MTAMSYEEWAEMEQGDELESLLSRWHHWQGGYKATRGFKSRALVVGDYQVSRQYDDLSGALDDDLENATMRKIDFEVSEMKDPHRAAIYCLARALCIGAAVFTSPRLPADPKERAGVVAKARVLLVLRLVNAGVMT